MEDLKGKTILVRKRIIVEDPKIIEQVLALRAEGSTHKQIADKLGISTATAHRITSESHPQKRKPAVKKKRRKTIKLTDPKIKDLIMSLSAKGLSQSDTAKRAGVSQSTVSAILRSDNRESERAERKAYTSNNRAKELEATLIMVRTLINGVLK